MLELPERLGRGNSARSLRPAGIIVALCGFSQAWQGMAHGQSQTTAPAEAAPTVNFLGLPAAPLDKPMVTDRPDFTESEVTVPFGRMQLEAGYTFAYDDENGRRESDQTFPELLLRIGLVPDFELRVGWSGMSLSDSLFTELNDVGRTVDSRDHDDGANDTSLGFKAHFNDQDGLVPSTGLIAELGIPTGTGNKTAGDVEPGVKWLWGYDLTDRWYLAGNVNMGVVDGDEGRFFQTAASVSTGFALTERLGTYAEYFGFYPNDRDADCAHYVNGGFTFLINNNLQFDVRAGVGLNEEADDMFTGAGFAIRW